MNTDEREIFNYLQTWGAEFVGAVEICRRAATKKRFYDDPDWAKPILISMKDRGILESDMQGRYRIKPIDKKKAGKLWVAPDIEKILQEGGQEVDNAAKDSDEEHYEQL